MKKDDIHYYEENALKYFNSTKDLDFDFNRQILLKYLKAGNYIFDVGCGSGRDSKAFINLGYKVRALDGSKELCTLATQLIEQEVICKNYYQINDINLYDAIWACASLVHLTNEELLEVIKILSKSLKLNGYFYMCFKYGFEEREDVINDRHFNDMTEDKFNDILKQIKNLKLLEYIITSDALQRDNVWLNIVLKKIK